MLCHHLPLKKDIRLEPFFKSQTIELEGQIVSDVETRRIRSTDKQVFELSLSGTYDGKVLVNFFPEQDLEYGQKIRLNGKLHRPFEFDKESRFSYREYLRRRGVHYILSVKKSSKAKIITAPDFSFRFYSLQIRSMIRDVFDQYLTPKESGIMKAMIVGDRSDLPKHIRGIFQQTGTMHILAISGLHMGLFSLILLAFVRLFPLSLKSRFIVIFILLFFYILMTGLRVSVIRSFLMIVLLFLGKIVERQTNVLNSLSLAGILILIFDPNQFFGLGFQLSFICVFAIIQISPIIRKMIFRKEFEKRGEGLVEFSSFIKNVKDSFVVSLSVWLATAGIIAYHFQIITPITVVVNLIVIPLLSIEILLSFLLILSSLFSSSLALIWALWLKVILNFKVYFISAMSQIPLSYFEIKNLNLSVCLFYYFFISIIFFISLKILNHRNKNSW